MKPETVWALKDVSFEVKGGDVVGVNGSNDAGKSRLLEILSRSTEPTEGDADVFGPLSIADRWGRGQVVVVTLKRHMANPPPTPDSFPLPPVAPLAPEAAPTTIRDKKAKK
jgi:ABC-type uncharacterized transport system ATPase subunit